MVKEREGAKEEDERKHWVVAGLPRLPGDPPPISPVAGEPLMAPPLTLPPAGRECGEES